MSYELSIRVRMRVLPCVLVCAHILCKAQAMGLDLKTLFFGWTRTLSQTIFLEGTMQM